MVSYRNLTLKTMFTRQYSYLLMLLFWPLHGLSFQVLESLTPQFHVIWCRLDDWIPFCEYFVIPYYFWFLFLFGMIVYSLLFDVAAFKKYMWFTILTYSITNVIYLIYPSQQLLRPESFAHDNLFTQIVSGLYAYDTNTNVCPSLHVTGSVAVVYAAWNSRFFGTPRWRAAFVLAAAAIIASTVFLKQHSAVDIFASFALCLVVHLAVFRLGGLCRGKAAAKKNGEKEHREAPERETALQ